MVKNISGKGATDSKLISYWTSSMIDMASHYKPQEIQAGKNYFAKPENLYGDLFKEYDVLLSAVTPMETPKFGVLSPTDDFKSKGEIFEKVMSLTAPTNAAGCCAMSVPLSRSKRTNMPIGSMFQAKSGDDRLLLELAYQLEEFKPWRDNWAPNSINFK